jgi:hypothetical protein
MVGPGEVDEELEPEVKEECEAKYGEVVSVIYIFFIIISDRFLFFRYILNWFYLAVLSYTYLDKLHTYNIIFPLF